MSKKLSNSPNYSVFFNNLITLCNNNNTSPTAIAEEFSNRSVLTAWKNGKIEISTINQIAEHFGVSVEYLLTGKETNNTIKVSPKEQELLSLYNKLSVHNQYRVLERAQTLYDIERTYTKPKIVPMRTIDIADVAAGAGISSPFTEDDEFYPRSFPKDEVPDNADCGIPISGDSMEPNYPDGCIVWVNRSAEVYYGDDVIAIYNNEPFCKIYQPDGLYSYNKNYNPKIVSESDVVSIYGKVIGYYMEDSN